MKNDPIEKQLQDLPWRQPSEDLKQRIFQDAPDKERVIEGAQFGKRIHLGWAAALIACAGVITFIMVNKIGDPIDSKTQPVANVEPQLINGATDSNFFDFTVAHQDPWPGEMAFELQPVGGGSQ